MGIDQYKKLQESNQCKMDDVNSSVFFGFYIFTSTIIYVRIIQPLSICTFHILVQVHRRQYQIRMVKHPIHAGMKKKGKIEEKYKSDGICGNGKLNEINHQCGTAPYYTHLSFSSRTSCGHSVPLLKQYGKA